MKQINAIVKLRRDNDYNFERIKNTFIPANGEAVLVDTSNTGLRIKIGDGVTTYANLPFADEDARRSVIMGYYHNGNFYKDYAKTQLIINDSNKLYIDKGANIAYYFNGSQYVNLWDYASDQKAGLVKLYDDLGNNTDGAITQRKVTEELNYRYKTSVDSEDELLIFSL